MRRLVAVVGPTAAGKSSLALTLAQRLGGEIVNSDSRQIYRGMDIGTAKPSPETRALLPHHLYDIADPAESYSLALYRRDALAAFEGIWARGEVAWLVGGTGQYVWALLEAWQVPTSPPNQSSAPNSQRSPSVTAPRPSTPASAPSTRRPRTVSMLATCAASSAPSRCTR